MKNDLTSSAAQAFPLEGLRVLELARILAGPWAGQTFADLGAEVIKVERRGMGDDTRQWGPPFIEAKDGGTLGAAYFHSCNRGKLSLEADYDNADDLARIKALALEADVIIENFKLGGLKKFGLDYESLKVLNPRLIYCSITGFGQNGPYAPRAGYDFMIQGMAGAMSITGEAGGQPLKAGYATADIFTGLYATIGALAALQRRHETGEGAYVDCALLDSQIAVLGNQAMNYLVSGKAPSRMGNAHPNLVPYEVFAVADGHIIIATGNDAQFHKLCRILGREDIARDVAYLDNKARIANRGTLIPVLTALTMQHKKADLLNALEQEFVPAGPINTIDDVFADPQVLARGMILSLDAPEAKGGKIPGLRSPIVMDGMPMASTRPSPSLGNAKSAGWSKPKA